MITYERVIEFHSSHCVLASRSQQLLLVPSYTRTAALCNNLPRNIVNHIPLAVCSSCERRLSSLKPIGPSEPRDRCGGGCRRHNPVGEDQVCDSV